MGKEQSRPVLLFDGPCHLCTKSVQFILARERAPVLQFAPLDSEKGRELLSAFRQMEEIAQWLDRPEAGVQSLVLIEAGRCYLRSEAVLRTAKYLRFPWSLLVVFRLVPPRLRDLIYRFIARNRYRWFGRREESGGSCPAPLASYRDRFL